MKKFTISNNWDYAFGMLAALLGGVPYYLYYQEMQAIMNYFDLLELNKKYAIMGMTLSLILAKYSHVEIQTFYSVEKKCMQTVYKSKWHYICSILGMVGLGIGVGGALPYMH